MINSIGDSILLTVLHFSFALTLVIIWLLICSVLKQSQSERNFISTWTEL